MKHPLAIICIAVIICGFIISRDKAELEDFFSGNHFVPYAFVFTTALFYFLRDEYASRSNYIFLLIPIVYVACIYYMHYVLWYIFYSCVRDEYRRMRQELKRLEIENDEQQTELKLCKKIIEGHPDTYQEYVKAYLSKWTAEHKDLENFE